MANRLDKLLEPGERVLYRDPVSWLPRLLLFHILYLCVLAEFALILALGTEAESGRVLAIALPMSADDRYVEIGRRSGETMRLSGLRKPQAFAVALAEAVGLPPPYLVGRLERMAETCFAFGGGSCLLLATPFLIEFMLARSSATLGHTAFGLLWILAVVFLALWIGTHFACVLGLVLLHRKVTAEEVRNWLCMRGEDALTDRASR